MTIRNTDSITKLRQPRQPQHRLSWLLWSILLIGVSFTLLLPPLPAHAQETNDPPIPSEPGPEAEPGTDAETKPPLEIDWRERPTDTFIILFAPGDEATAEAYAGFVDTIYEELTTLFSHKTETPLTLRLYPTQESYEAVNPLAPKVAGIVAHADFRRHEVAVILPVTAQQSPEEKQNNVRHELTHIIAAELSRNRLNTGFQEGIAQYVETHTPALSKKIAYLQQAHEQGLLLPWSVFDSQEKVYEQPHISYPQTLSVVAFLIETYGFGAFREFLTGSAQSSGYRSSLERTYGESSSDLEAAWLAWLPSFIEGGYRHNALTSYDLSFARQLLQQGRYQEAQTELEQAMAWLHSDERRPMPQEQVQAALQEAEELLQRSRQGQEAEWLAAEARAALEAADYERASHLIPQARAVYAVLGDTRQEQVLQIYAERVERGLYARNELERAMSLAQALKFPQARQASDTAAVEFARLGDRASFEQAVAFRRSLDSRQQLAGTLLIAFGVVSAILSLGGRWFLREQEAW